MVAARFLLDSNVVSEPTRPKPNRQLLTKLERHQYSSAVPAPAWHELWWGVRRLPDSRKRSQLERYLRESIQPVVPILPYDEAAADYHASERARLEALGLMPPFLDGQIAAIAHVHNLVLVTSNVADFRHFEDVEVVDWRSPG